MLLIIGLVTLLFIYSAFTTIQSTPQINNPFYTYYAQQLFFISKHFILFLLGFIVLTLVFFRYNFDKKYSLFKIYFFSTLQTFFVAVTGFLLAYILLFVIAIIQLNISATIINYNAKLFGIEDNKNIIFKRLQTTSRPPEIIASERDQKEILRAIAAATTGTDSWYGSVLLASLPGVFIFSTDKLHSSILLIDNTLIITKIDAEDMQIISPLVGYRFVKNYFPSRAIKYYPKVTIMNRQEYEEYRKEDAKKKIVKIDGQIKKIESYVSSISASIENNKKENTVQNQNTLNEYRYYADFFKKQKNVLQQQVEKLPHENGVFQSPDAIKLTLATDNPHAIADYFATVTHEYFHYASYVSNEQRFESTFFEEGLTEYFARAAIKDALHTSTNLGYPVQVKIMSEITNLITETELADIYFEKDEFALEKALDRVYGDEFYQNNFVLFETLQYASTPQQTLGIANEIMKRIGGSALTEKDLYSSYSKL